MNINIYFNNIVVFKIGVFRGKNLVKYHEKSAIITQVYCLQGIFSKTRLTHSLERNLDLFDTLKSYHATFF